MPKNKLQIIKQEQLLKFVDECKDVKDLNKFFPENIANMLSKKISLLPYPLKNRNQFKLSQSLIAAIENSSIPVDIFWVVVSFISLSSAALLIMGIVIAGITLMIAAASCMKIYVKKEKKFVKDKKYFQLALLKMYILDDLLVRNNTSERASDAVAILNKKITFPSESTVSKKPAVVLAVALSIIITTTFYWGITDILTVVGLISATSLLITPMAIAIAASIALTLSIFLAVKYYHAKVQQRNCEVYKNYFDQVIDQKRSQLGLKMLLHSKQFTQAHKITAITHQSQHHIPSVTFGSLFRKKKIIIDTEQPSTVIRRYSF